MLSCFSNWAATAMPWTPAGCSRLCPWLSLPKSRRPQRVWPGFFNHRGRAVPAIDLSELTCGQPAAERLSTRILLINYPDAAGREHPLGLIAEHATELIRREREESRKWA